MRLPIDAAGFAARQFGHVGIFLLRHERRAGGEGVADRDEAELARRPEDHVLAQPRKMHGDQREGGEQFARRSRGRSRRPCEFCVTAGKSSSRATSSRSSRKRRAGDRAGAERQDVDPLAGIGEPLRVALQHLHIGEQMMREKDRLRALQMRVAGNDHVAIAARRARRAPRCISRSRCGERVGIRRAGRAGDRARPGRCGCARCGASRRRRRSGASAPPRCSCGCLRART